MTRALFIALFFICSLIYSQNLKDQDLIGTWKVEQLDGHAPKGETAEEQERVGELTTALRNATFVFTTDKRFTLNLDLDAMGDMLIDKKWTYDPIKSEVIIQELDAQDSSTSQLMVISVLNRNGNIYFILTESPYILQVVKQ